MQTRTLYDRHNILIKSKFINIICKGYSRIQSVCKIFWTLAYSENINYDLMLTREWLGTTVKTKNWSRTAWMTFRLVFNLLRICLHSYFSNMFLERIYQNRINLRIRPIYHFTTIMGGIMSSLSNACNVVPVPLVSYNIVPSGVKFRLSTFISSAALPLLLLLIFMNAEHVLRPDLRQLCSQFNACSFEILTSIVASYQ